MKIAALLLCASIVHCAQPKGIDVSQYQPSVNWNQVKANGIEFVYIKATEGITYKSSTFNKQFIGATQAGLIRGAYHFALPNASSGVAQAKFFVRNGGGWSKDGRTLPGAVDLEYNPYGTNECYGLNVAEMVKWIRDFSNTYKGWTGRRPVIYTSTSWWQLCTGNYAGFGQEHPLWLARYASAPGSLPAGWSYYTFWQHSDNAQPNPGSADLFNGDTSSLQSLIPNTHSHKPRQC
ncbi:MAG: glycoside hydrolase family 25 protein [Linnemannia elongata]|nr:MAG: glycoside hydrolase family 25 protein [Linnemannia elongata]